MDEVTCWGEGGGQGLEGPAMFRVVVKLVTMNGLSYNSDIEAMDKDSFEITHLTFLSSEAVPLNCHFVNFV